MSDETFPEREVVVTFRATGTVRLLANSENTNAEASEVLRTGILDDLIESLGLDEDFVLSHSLEVEVETKDA